MISKSVINGIAPQGPEEGGSGIGPCEALPSYAHFMQIVQPLVQLNLQSTHRATRRVRTTDFPLTGDDLRESGRELKGRGEVSITITLEVG